MSSCSHALLPQYPLVSDLSGAISEAFGCRWLAGHSCRATYILDPNGTIKHLSMNVDPCGRNVVSC